MDGLETETERLALFMEGFAKRDWQVGTRIDLGRGVVVTGETFALPELDVRFTIHREGTELSAIRVRVSGCGDTWLVPSRAQLAESSKALLGALVHRRVRHTAPLEQPAERRATVAGAVS